MGVYVNPGSEQFRQAMNNPLFVDKSGLISFTNSRLGYSTVNRICVSRPRRFGKTMAVDMLAAYYSKKGDSRDLFFSLEIAKDPSFEEHLTKQ